MGCCTSSPEDDLEKVFNEFWAEIPITVSDCEDLVNTINQNPYEKYLEKDTMLFDILYPKYLRSNTHPEDSMQIFLKFFKHNTLDDILISMLLLTKSNPIRFQNAFSKLLKFINCDFLFITHSNQIRIKLKPIQNGIRTYLNLISLHCVEYISKYSKEDPHMFKLISNKYFCFNVRERFFLSEFNYVTNRVDYQPADDIGLEHFIKYKYSLFSSTGFARNLIINYLKRFEEMSLASESDLLNNAKTTHLSPAVVVRQEDEQEEEIHQKGLRDKIYRIESLLDEKNDV